MSARNYTRYRYCRLKLSVGVRRCTYPSIHFFVSRSWSDVDCALCGVVWYVWCEGGVCTCSCTCTCSCSCTCTCTLCCGVVCSVGGVWCGVVLCCSVWCGAAWHAENTSVCRFKTPPCVRSRRLRVYRENARMCWTCGRFPGTHGGVLNAHTEAF